MGVGFLMILQPSHILKVHIRASCQFQWEENFWKIWCLQWNLIFLCKCPSSDTINQSMKVKRQGYIYKVHISITLFYFISQTETVLQCSFSFSFLNGKTSYSLLATSTYMYTETLSEILRFNHSQPCCTMYNYAHVLQSNSMIYYNSSTVPIYYQRKYNIKL